MDALTRFVISTLRHTYEQGATDVNETVLEMTAELMILRRDEVIAIDEVLHTPLPPTKEVG
jgi:hypothetical protein